MNERSLGPAGLAWQSKLSSSACDLERSAEVESLDE